MGNNVLDMVGRIDTAARAGGASVDVFTMVFRSLGYEDSEISEAYGRVMDSGLYREEISRQNVTWTRT